MYCSHCGSALPEGSVFCPHCGVKINTADQPVPELPITGAAMPAAPSIAEEASVPADAPVAEEFPTQGETPFAAEVPAPYASPATEGNPGSDAFPAAEGTPFDAGIAPAPLPRKRSRKRLVFSLIAAVLVLALLAGGMVYAFVLNTPEARLLRALENTGEALEDVFARCKNLNALAARGGELSASGKLSYALELSSDSGYQPFSYKLCADTDLENKQLGGSLDFTVDDAIPPIQLQFYLDEESFVLGLPQLLDGVYSIPMKDFGKKLLASPLAKLAEIEDSDALSELSFNFFAEISWDDFREQYPEETAAFLDSIQIEESDEVIPKAEDGLEVYSLRVDWQCADALLHAYMEYSICALYGTDALLTQMDFEEIDNAFAALDDAASYLLIGINDDNCISALYLTDEAQTYTATLLLEGRQNLWNDVTLLVDGKTVATACLQSTADGFQFEIEAEDTTLTIACDDAEGLLTFAASGRSSAMQEFRYELTDGGLHIYTVSPAEDFRFDLRLLPLQQIDKLSDEPTDLFSVSTAKLQGIAMEFYYNLQSLIQ
ncbi:MAG: zinc-ribbon domain-containing protein [Faecousia sp.]